MRSREGGCAGRGGALFPPVSGLHSSPSSLTPPPSQVTAPWAALFSLMGIPPPSQVTAPWAALFSLMGIAAHVPGVLLRVDPARVLPALLIVVLVNLLAFVVQLAADLRTRHLFVRADQSQQY